MVLDGGGDGFVLLGEVVVQGVAADEDGELYVGHGLDESGVPFGGAFGAWGEVATLARAGVAEAHGDQGDEVGVVELFVGDVEPFAEALAGFVVPGDAGLVRDGAGGLADDHDARLLRALQQRARLGGEVLGADRAFACVGDDFEGAGHGRCLIWD